MSYNQILAVRRAIEKYFNVNIEIKSRKYKSIIARQFYNKWLRSNTEMSYIAIANTLPGLSQDHSTIINSINQYDSLFFTEKEYKLQWKECCELINKGLVNVVDEELLVLNAS